MKNRFLSYFMRRLGATALAIGLGTAAAVTIPASAVACGGFFCSNLPIDQTGEDILFATEEGKVRAYIRIFYQGEAKDFAWVVPVASKPTVSVGTATVFTRVDQVTRPIFNLEWDWGSGCFYPPMAASEGDFDNTDGGGGGKSVTVVDTGQVGPYDYAVVESNDAALLTAWLNENDFDQPPEAEPLIAHYVENDMMFVALKLQQDKGVGDIAPLVLDFNENNPCVPLILTRIAATPDMPVRVYVLSDQRAIPTNWLHVEINEKKIDWLSGGGNYEQVVTAAVDEAAGRAFVTEFAGSSEPMKSMLYTEGQYQLDQLKTITHAGQFIMALQGQFQASQELLNLMRKHVPLPESLAAQGVTEQQFYNFPDNYEAEYAKISFDPNMFVADLETVIVKPLKEAQEMFDKHPYLTRLFTTVSPDEMTRDPLFGYNNTLGDVSNVHTAKLVTECDGETTTKVEIVLSNGETFVPDLTNWWYSPIGGDAPEATDLSAEPAATKIELLGETGPARALGTQEVEFIDRQLDILPPEQVEVTGIDPAGNPGTNLPGGTTSGDNEKKGGCSVGGAASMPFWLSLLAGLSVVVRRRRR